MSYNVRPTLLYQNLADVTIANDATERSCLSPTAWSSNGVYPPTVPKITLNPGTKLQFTAWGAYQLPAVVNLLKLTFKISIGGVSFSVDIDSTLFTLLSLANSTPQPCYFNSILTHRGGGVLKRVGSLAFLDGGGNFRYQSLRGANLTVDPALDNAFDATAKWSAANTAASLIVESAELAMIG